MRVSCVISSLSSGGSERVLSSLTNILSAKGWEVQLITISGEKKDFFDISPNVERVALGLEGNSLNLIHGLIHNKSRANKIRKTITKYRPDIVLAFGDRTNLLVLLALVGTKIPVVVSERTDPFALNIGFPWHLLRPWVYKIATAIVVQTQMIADSIKQNWKIYEVEVVPNLLPKDIPEVRPWSSRKNIVLSVGRLGREKGHDVLIDAWAKIHKMFPGWRLRVVGDGSQSEILQKHVYELKIEDSVDMPGRIFPIWPEYQNAKVFVLPSRREGFPNVLIEALAMGCVCISSNCNSGPREILENGQIGELFSPENSTELAERLKYVLLDSEQSQLAKDHSKKTRECYGDGAIVEIWQQILERAAKS